MKKSFNFLKSYEIINEKDLECTPNNSGFICLVAF